MVRTCVRCGLAASGVYDSSYICQDCLEFSPIVLGVWDDVDSKMRSGGAIDPRTNPVFRLLSDVTFVATTNTQFRIFYNACELLVSRAISGQTEILEAEFIRVLRTTRSKTDLLDALVELDLIQIRSLQHDRKLVFREKLLKMAGQYLADPKLTKEITERHAHIYAGYILIYLLTKVAELDDHEQMKRVPYGKKPRTLWATLMFLWSRLAHRELEFTSEELRSFLAKRGILSSAADSIARRLQMIDGKTTQSLVDKAELTGGTVRFTLDSYAVREMQRIRRVTRTRQRGSIT